jgi:hypothetical protein
MISNRVFSNFKDLLSIARQLPRHTPEELDENFAHRGAFYAAVTRGQDYLAQCYSVSAQVDRQTAAHCPFPPKCVHLP